MRESTKLPESKINEIFGYNYIQNCVWVPWAILAILLVATRLQGTMRMMAWGSVCMIGVINVAYILYCVIQYIFIKRKKGTL